MKREYTAPNCIMLAYSKEDILSLSNGNGANNRLAEYSLAEFFEA